LGAQLGRHIAVFLSHLHHIFMTSPSRWRADGHPCQRRRRPHPCPSTETKATDVRAGR